MTKTSDRITPSAVAKMLVEGLPVVPMMKTVLDAAAGPGVWGHHYKMMRNPGAHLTGVEVDPKYAGEGCHKPSFDTWITADFLQWADNVDKGAYDFTICNPRFELMMPFIQAARRISKHGMAFFMSTAYLTGKARRINLWGPFPPSKIIIMDGRIVDGGRDMHGRMLVYWKFEPNYADIRHASVQWVGSYDPEDYVLREEDLH